MSNTEKIKIDTPLDDIIKKFNIDLDSIKNESVKPMTVVWRWELIIECVEKLEKFKPYKTIINEKERTIMMGFNSTDEINGFESELNRTISKNINEFLVRKGEIPTNFRRNITYTLENEGKQLTLRAI